MGALYSNRRILLREPLFIFIPVTYLALQSTLCQASCQLKVCSELAFDPHRKYDTQAGKDAPRLNRFLKVRKQEFNIELLFKALADPTRLRLIHLLGDHEICVCSFVETLKTNQPKVSRHLAYLRRAGLVASRREGKWAHYRLVEPTDPQAAKIVRNVREWLASSLAD